MQVLQLHPPSRAGLRCDRGGVDARAAVRDRCFSLSHLPGDLRRVEPEPLLTGRGPRG
ncbi:hypothetical protein VARIO8X_110197 [Burkholderiales bacterium 8X]|nr:hypothetical protein VARIO8X_110197 [Burkholderiales bacterium 8X]